MCGLFQPIGQVRLTNVATVRLKAGGERFEVACYKNKVLNWRSGVETDIHEVLQCPYVFTSISKGKLAKNEQLIKAFGTKDLDTISKQILDKGEIQVGKEERNQMLQATFKDVVTILSEVAINPKTGHPLTSTLIENTLKASAFSITLKEPAKKQALKALAHLQQLYPNDIARSQMRLKITCSLKQRHAVLQFLHSQSAYVEHDGIAGASKRADAARSRPSAAKRSSSKDSSQESTPSSEFSGDEDDDGDHDKGNGDRKDGNDKRRAKNDAVVSIRFLCCTKIYRDVDQFVAEGLKPPGSLQLVSLNVRDAGNKGLAQHAEADEAAPLESKATLDDTSDQRMVEGMEKLTVVQRDETGKTMETTGRTEPTKSTEPEEHTEATETTEPPKRQHANPNKKSAFKCTNCKMEFNSATEYRSHCKSELHVVNNKMTLKGLPPITQEEFKTLKICMSHSSLDG